MQELKCEAEKFPFEAIKNAGYHAEMVGQKTYNGVAILTKKPPKDVITTLDGLGDQSRFIAAEVEGVRAVCLYVPNGFAVGDEKYEYKLDWLKHLQAGLKKSGWLKEKCVVTGDFNIAPTDDDVHDPKKWKDKILCSKPERKAFQDLEALGLVDTFRLHHKEAGHFSWWDYRKGFMPNQGLRIDFVMATENLAKQCVYSRIDTAERRGEQPSDHAPVISEFQ